MTGVFVDSSIVIALAFGEPGTAAVVKRLRSADRVLAAPLLEAEVSAACHREDRPVDEDLFAAIEWVHADRSLGPEIGRVLKAGDVRGADCWHLAVALFATPDPRQAAFLTLDARQRAVAKALGFST